MLVLTRKLNEEIRIDGEITVTVIELDGNRVRLGIKAPPEVRILRGELQTFEEQPKRKTRKKTYIRRRVPAERGRSYASAEYAEAT